MHAVAATDHTRRFAIRLAGMQRTTCLDFHLLIGQDVTHGRSRELLLAAKVCVPSTLKRRSAKDGLLAGFLLPRQCTADEWTWP